MATDRSQKRIDALRRWREVTPEEDVPLPSDGDLVKIGAAGQWDIPHVARSVVRPWRDALDFVMTQANLGVNDPAEHMPDEMRAPQREPIEPSPNGTERGSRPGPVLRALLEWRSATERTDPGVRRLKDHHLKTVSRAGRRTAPDIASRLPADVRRFAVDLARVVGEALEPETNDALPEDEIATGGRREECTYPDRIGSDDPAPDGPQRPTPASASGARSAGHSSAGRAAVAAGTATQVSTTRDTDLPRAAEVDADEEIRAEQFAPFDFAPAVRPPEPLTVSIGTDGSPELRWDPAPGDWVVYRVVTSDRVVPYSPEGLDESDEIDVVAVTRRTTTTDDRPFTAALRHATVWCHSGADRAAALRTPPVLHAARSFVAPVVNLRIGEDEGCVVGRWTALPGTDTVRVVRVRTDRAGPHGRAAGQHDIDADLGGFTDESVEPGGTYRYLVQAAVRDGAQGELLAQSCVRTVAVTAVLDPVTDLEWREIPGEARRLLDLVWTPPRLGLVEVYRTQAAPEVGARGGLLDEAMLESEEVGLPGSARQDHRRQPVEGGRTGMLGVSWPAGWTRVYLTPVTVHGGRARIGVTTVATRTESPRNPRIVERVDHQVLTFEWPEGAAAVEVYQGAAGEGPDTATGSEPVAQITREDYEGLGGLQFRMPLEARGCSLHLVAVSWSKNQAVPSQPVSIEYPGLYRIQYVVTARGTRRRPGLVAVQLVADIPMTGPPPFALVFNAGRLPLAVDDGTSLVVAEESGEQGVWRVQPDRLGPQGGGTWLADLPPTGGWVRLLVDLPPHILSRVQTGKIAPIAVRDPHPGTLRFGPANGRRA